MTDTAAAPADSEPAYSSHTSIRLGTGKPMSFIERTATIPGLAEPLVYGVREPWHATYHVAPEDFPERPTTNDVFIASVGGCMVGVLGGMLAARKIFLSGENCTVEVDGEIGPPDEGKGSIIVRAVTVAVRLTGFDEAQRATIDRVHPHTHEQCWLSQTLAGSRCQVSMTVEHVDDER